jgi:putative membrane protein
MKKYLRIYLINVASLWLVSYSFGGLNYTGGYQSLIIGALALTLVNLLIRPIINLLLLPINLITLGTFRWLVNVIALYLVTLLIPQLIIQPFLFPGLSFQGFIIPSFYLNYFWSLTITSFLISLSVSLLSWLLID